MTTLPLGLGAYKRAFGDMPEVKLVNRFVERTPTNLKEHVALLSRPGTVPFERFPADTASGRWRGGFSKQGLFNSDLFVVSGTVFYRWDGTTRTHVAGEVEGTEAPRVAWAKGEGYEYLFITDGTLLQYYDGGSKASGVLTSDGTQEHTAVIDIGGVYYTWSGSLTDANSDGSLTHPWVVKPGATAVEDLANLATTLNFSGTPGTDFSSTLGGPSLTVTGVADADTLTATYLTSASAGNSVATTVPTGTHLSWGAATLAGGGVHALHGVQMPDGIGAIALSALESYVLVAAANSRKFFFIRPGNTTIDPEDFMEKESQPDPIVDMCTVGDVLVIAGTGSTEFWSATGNQDAPFAPVEGRTMSRGIVKGTMVPLDEQTFACVGNDWRVYIVGSTPQVISDHGMEERIRVQLRAEAGVS